MASPPIQAGGGGGTGGYGFELTNDLGKVYTTLPVGHCPATPVATPLRGGATDLELLGPISYPSGYALDRPVSTPSAHYLDYTSYDRSCKGGYRKTKKAKKAAKGKKSAKAKRRTTY
jgi:hypothetical protein